MQQNQETFNIRNIDFAREGSNRMNTMDWLRKERSYKDNEHVVGFKEDADKLMSELVKEVKDRHVISIVGTGGLGKTTIARKLYNTRLLQRNSTAIVGFRVQGLQNPRSSSINNKIFQKAPTTKEEIEFLEKMKEDDLEPHLRDYLNGHRYLVVLDDVWDVNAWPSLMRAFPNENNGSRVILTTRIKAVAESSDETTYVYELPFLKDEESWELFCSKAFPNYDDEVGNKKNRCPPHLESLAREMVSKCRGLPLAIVVLEKLPKLTILVMFGCGLTELVCSSAEGFSQLQIPRIVVCDMNKFQVEEGGMPVLKGLSIQGNCDLSIPDRLRTFPAPQTHIDWFEWAFGSCLFHFANNGCLNKCA